MRLFHSATIFCCYICTFVVWNFTRLITRLERVFFNSIWWGALSSNVFTICAVYWSLGRRGRFKRSCSRLIFKLGKDIYYPKISDEFDHGGSVSLNMRIVDHLTHWGRVTHICVSKLTITGSDNGLSPDRRQAIIWTNAGILLIGPLGTNFNEILVEIITFSFKKMRLKVSSAKWRPFCLGLNVLMSWPLLTFLN